MKKLYLIILLVALIILAGCNQDNSITVGATFPLTGMLAMYGNAEKNGLVLAQEEINANGGINGKILHLELMDNKGESTTVVNDVMYLSDVKNTPVIFNGFEYLTLPSKEITERKNKIMITFTTYRLNNSNLVFRDFWDFGILGKEFALIANERGSKMSIVALSESGYTYLKREIDQNYNGVILGEYMFNYGENDFRTSLTKIKATDTDTVLIFGFPEQIRNIVKQMKELGMTDYNVILTEGSEEQVTSGNEEFLQEVNAITYLSSELVDNPDFATKYEQRFGLKPRPESYYAYDSLKLVASAFKVCDNQIECLKQNIQDNFDSNHNRFREIPLVQYDRGWNMMSD